MWRSDNLLVNMCPVLKVYATLNVAECNLKFAALRDRFQTNRISGIRHKGEVDSSVGS